MRHDVSSMTDPSTLFEDAVLSSFAFLEQRYGFSRSTLRPTRQAVVVRYESPSLFVNLTFEPPAYEPEMSFGRLGVDDQQGGFSFEAGDLFQLQNCQEWAAPDLGSSGVIEAHVAWFASLLNECGKPCLLGDPAIYAEMKSRREALVAEWEREERNKGRSSDIEAAWNAKDYRAVVALCSGYEGALSNIDQKRLEIAKRKG